MTKQKRARTGWKENKNKKRNILMFIVVNLSQITNKYANQIRKLQKKKQIINFVCESLSIH